MNGGSERAKRRCASASGELPKCLRSKSTRRSRCNARATASVSVCASIALRDESDDRCNSDVSRSWAVLAEPMAKIEPGAAPASSCCVKPAFSGSVDCSDEAVLRTPPACEARPFGAAAAVPRRVPALACAVGGRGVVGLFMAAAASAAVAAATAVSGMEATEARERAAAATASAASLTDVSAARRAKSARWSEVSSFTYWIAVENLASVLTRATIWRDEMGGGGCKLKRVKKSVKSAFDREGGGWKEVLTMSIRSLMALSVDKTAEKKGA
eukprot:5892768-Pleurochrysis_carterae.AAC.1